MRHCCSLRPVCCQTDLSHSSYQIQKGSASGQKHPHFLQAVKVDQRRPPRGSPVSLGCQTRFRPSLLAGKAARTHFRQYFPTAMAVPTRSLRRSPVVTAVRTRMPQTGWASRRGPRIVQTPIRLLSATADRTRPYPSKPAVTAARKPGCRVRLGSAQARTAHQRPSHRCRAVRAGQRHLWCHPWSTAHQTRWSAARAAPRRGCWSSTALCRRRSSPRLGLARRSCRC